MIDHYWENLSAAPEAEAYGWLKDRFGVSWQVGPMELNAMICGSDQERIDGLTRALLMMKKLDLAALRAGWEAPPGSD